MIHYVWRALKKLELFSVGSLACEQALVRCGTRSDWVSSNSYTPLELSKLPACLHENARSAEKAEPNN